MGGLKRGTMRDQTKALATTKPAGMISAFANSESFEAAQRMAKAFAASTLVPKEYQGNIPNVLIAMELANRIGASPLMVAQNLDIIHGRPSWRAQFLIATVNASKRFTPLRYRFEGKPGQDAWGCRCYAQDRETGEECLGALVTIGMAKAEGWHGKSGSKWKTMPELMLQYRSAAFWTRTFCPEISLGLQTAEEIVDTEGYELPASIQPGDPADLERALLGVSSEEPSSPRSEPPPVEEERMREPVED